MAGLSTFFAGYQSVAHTGEVAGNGVPQPLAAAIITAYSRPCYREQH